MDRALRETVKNSTDRNVIAHPASNGLRNNWFMKMAEVLDLINYGPQKPGEVEPAGWVCASERFMSSEYGKAATKRAAALRIPSKSRLV